jgi:hypothetical protein
MGQHPLQSVLDATERLATRPQTFTCKAAGAVLDAAEIAVGQILGERLPEATQRVFKKARDHAENMNIPAFIGALEAVVADVERRLGSH